MNTSTQMGYKMPAEWETHSATLMHWPSNQDTWPGDRLKRVEQVFLNIIEVLHLYEPVLLVVDSSLNQKNVRKKLVRKGIDLAKIKIHSRPINDVWTRDCGPIFIKKEGSENGEYAITDWEYNAWGGKYPPFNNDNKIPAWFSETFHLERFKPGMVLEGGSIETNGEGVFLTTDSVLLNENRNPGMRRSEIEKNLQSFLGAEEIIWLKGGLAGDDTDGHIDGVARFLDRNTVLTTICDDPEDVNYSMLKENFEILKRYSKDRTNPFEIVTLPLPETKIAGTTVDGSGVVPASYTNFYLANGLVLVPLYDERFDKTVIDLFKRYFSERDVIGIECADLVWGQGSIHCITQQVYGIDI